MIKSQGLTDLQQSFYFFSGIRNNYEHSQSRETKTFFFLKLEIYQSPQYSFKKQLLVELQRKLRVFFIIIHFDQTGFIKGIFIGENIRLVYDFMHYTEMIQVPGLLILIDFLNAFDTNSWNFKQDAIHFSNYGDTIKLDLHLL